MKHLLSLGAAVLFFGIVFYGGENKAQERNEVTENPVPFTGRVILDFKEFRSTLFVGDTFWYLGSLHGAPSRILGPYTIKGFEQTERDSVKVKVCREDIQGNRLANEVLPRCWYVYDLTNRWHGVLLTEEDARAYLRARKRAYAADPVFIEEVRLATEQAQKEQRLYMIELGL